MSAANTLATCDELVRPGSVRRCRPTPCRLAMSPRATRACGPLQLTALGLHELLDELAGSTDHATLVRREPLADILVARREEVTRKSRSSSSEDHDPLSDPRPQRPAAP